MPPRTSSDTSKKRQKAAIESSSSSSSEDDDFDLIEEVLDDSESEDEIEFKPRRASSSSNKKQNSTQKKNTNSSSLSSSSNKKKQTTNNRKKKKKNSSDEESSSNSDSEEKNKKKSKKTDKKKTQPTEKDKEKMNKLWERFVTGKPRLLIGCHVAFGSLGIEHAPLAAAENGCCGAFALFLGNQKTYAQKDYTDKQVSKFIENCKALNYDRDYLLPHASYLINLANPDKEKLAKSKTLFLTEYKKCERLGLKRYNFHPGSTVGETTVENGCKQIAECINWANSQVDNVISVLECVAGSGNTIGHKFEQLKMIIDHVEDKNRVGICLDTCHMFAAGYDLRTQEGCKKVFDEFDQIIGFKYLKGMHLNDSKENLNSKKDRHEDIGQGHLGLEVFKYIVNNPKFRNIPLILETPGGNYIKEIAELYDLYTGEEDEVKPSSSEISN